MVDGEWPGGLSLETRDRIPWSLGSGSERPPVSPADEQVMTVKYPCSVYTSGQDSGLRW